MIVIIVILAAMLLPALMKVQARAQTTSCINNLKSFGVAGTQYADDFKGATLWNRDVTTTLGNSVNIYYTYISPYLGGPSTSVILSGGVTGWEWLPKTLICPANGIVVGNERLGTYGYMYFKGQNPPASETVYRSIYKMATLPSGESASLNIPVASLIIAGDAKNHQGDGKNHLLGATENSTGKVYPIHNGSANLLHLGGWVSSRIPGRFLDNSSLRIVSDESGGNRIKGYKITKYVAGKGNIVLP